MSSTASRSRLLFHYYSDFRIDSVIRKHADRLLRPRMQRKGRDTKPECQPSAVIGDSACWICRLEAVRMRAPWLAAQLSKSVISPILARCLLYFWHPPLLLLFYKQKKTKELWPDFMKAWKWLASFAFCLSFWDAGFVFYFLDELFLPRRHWTLMHVSCCVVFKSNSFTEDVKRLITLLSDLDDRLLSSPCINVLRGCIDCAWASASKQAAENWVIF